MSTALLISIAGCVGKGNLHFCHVLIDGMLKEYLITVEHTYDACPKYSELGSFRIIAYLYVSVGSRRWQRQYSKKKVQRFYI